MLRINNSDNPPISNENKENLIQWSNNFQKFNQSNINIFSLFHKKYLKTTLSIITLFFIINLSYFSLVEFFPLVVKQFQINGFKIPFSVQYLYFSNFLLELISVSILSFIIDNSNLGSRKITIIGMTFFSTLLIFALIGINFKFLNKKK